MSLLLFLIPIHSILYAQECTGTSNETSQDDPLNYKWTFKTTPVNEGEFTFDCIDEKVGLVAFFWNQTNGFAETQMNNTPGTQSFTYKTIPMEEGSVLKFSCKFAYAGGMSVTRQFEFKIGDCKEGSSTEDSVAPTGFTASVKNVSYTDATIEVQALDDSGNIIYTISREGAQNIIFTAVSDQVTERKINGLTPGTAYTLSVRAEDGTGNRAANSPVTLDFTTLQAEESECGSISGEVTEGEPVGYRWSAKTTSANEVRIDFECLDEKTGLVAYFWNQTAGFTETPMISEPGTQKFTYTSDPQEIGTVLIFSCKFAYAGGSSVTKQFQFTVGNCKEGDEPGDTEAPTDFTAIIKSISPTEATVEVNAKDNSGHIIYTISRDGAENIVFSAPSGISTEKTITGLASATSYTLSISAKDASENIADNSPLRLNFSTSENQELDCTGTSSEISQDNPLTYGWTFKTTPAYEADITFECLDEKIGLVAFLWDQTEGFTEIPMTNIPGTQKFTYKSGSRTIGETIKFSCKFAYAGGQSVTRQFEFTIGDCKEGVEIEDTEAPTNFTASVKEISYGEVTVEVNAEDNSGTIVYTIERDETEPIVFSAVSGVATQRTISNLDPGTNYTIRIHAKDASGNAASNNPESLSFTTLAAENTECDGIGYAYENDPSVKPIFHYHISTTADRMVKIDLEFQQVVTGLMAQILVLWPEGGEAIIECSADGENKYTATIPYNAAGDPFTIGQTTTFKGRFPYAGGLALTTPFTYTAGNNCSGVGINETRIEKEKLYISAGSFANTVTVTGTNGIREWNLYTVQGKRIIGKRNDGNTITIPAARLEPGIYLLITQDNNGNSEYLKIRK